MTKYLRGLLSVALITATAGLVEASVSVLWQELAGSASETGLSNTPEDHDARDPAVAVGADGRPVVVYTEHARWSHPEANGPVIVKRWTGSAWQTLSGPGGLGHGRRPQIRISSNGMYYVAWMREDSDSPTSAQVYLVHRTASGSWQQLGGSNGPGGLTGVFDRPGTFGVNAFVRSFSLALTLDGHPMVAFDSAAQTEQTEEGAPPPEGILYGSGQVYVKRYNPASNAWDYLGSDPFTGGGASAARSFFVQAGTGYVTHFASNPSLAVRSDGTPLVAFAYGTWYDGPGGTAFIPDGSEIFVTQFANGAWTALGPAVPQLDDSPAAHGGTGGVSDTAATSVSPALATGPLNEVWVAWFEHAYGFPPFSVFARRWSGVSWDELAGSGSGNGLSNPEFANGYPALAIGPDRIPVVAYSSQAPDRGPRIFVKQGDGAFMEMGADSAEQDGISGEDWARTPMIAGSAGGPAIVWLAGPDVSPRSTQVFLRQFSAVSFRLDVAIRGNGSSVISTPYGIDCPGQACDEVFPAGTLVALEAVPGPDELFDRWSGACMGTAACTVRMSGPRSVNASFVGAAMLSVTKIGTGAGFGAVSGLRVACGGDCDEKYRLGTSVTLTVSVPTGTLFGGWGGDCAFRGRNTSCALTMSADRSVTAEFTQRVYRLAVTATTPPGTSSRPPTGRVQSSHPAGIGIDCAVGAVGTCAAEVPHGARVRLTAVATPGNRLLSWNSGPCGSRTTTACEFTMATNTSVGALFRGVTVITVGKLGNGQGRITGPGIDCGGDCVGEVVTDVVTAVAFTPGPGTTFRGWEGVHCLRPTSATTTTCQFITSYLPAGSGDSTTADTPISRQEISARSELRRHALRLVVDGAGIVTAPGLDCGGLPGHTDCGEEHDYGTSVTLAAVPATDTMVGAWTGCSRVNGSVCVVDMTANRTVRARFVGARTLDVMALGNGRGRITAPTAPPLACLANCSASRLVSVNATVVLTPRPDAGSSFRWMDATDMCMPGSSCWMGNIMCSGRGPCAVPMSQNRTALGRFTLNRHRLTVTRPLTGGSVAGTTDLPEPIDCGPAGSQCTSTADFGTPVGLQATAEADYIFTRWAGSSPCSAGARATEAVCTFALQGDVTATPVFRRRTLVSLAKDGTGTGTVTATGALLPVSVSCGPACGEADFQAFDGRDVTLRATASVGSTFTGFTGACGSNATVCTFTPAGASQEVAAGFTLQTRTLNVNVRGVGSVIGALQTCGADESPCAITGLFGDTIELWAFAGPENRLLSWAGCSSVNGLLCRVRLSGPTPAPVSVTATFTVSLMVGSVGDGAGSVTGPGIACGEDCVQTYPPGTPVTLTRVNGPGAGFAGWGQDCEHRARNASCALTMTGNRYVSADFMGPRALVINKVGRGGGSVTSQPAGIACGDVCEFFFPVGALVTLVATAAPGAVFEGFTASFVPPDPPVCESRPTPTSCRVRMTEQRMVDLRFEPTNELTVTRPGPGNGAVVSEDGQIDCSANFACTARYPIGAEIVLTHHAADGSRFGSWSGPCAGQDTCTITMIPGGVTVAATFEHAPSVSIGFVGAGAGFVDVTTEPAGSSTRCESGADCRIAFDLGASVILTATATSGGFVEWGGACEGTPRSENCRLGLLAFFHFPFVTVTFLADPVVALVLAGPDVLIFGDGPGCDRPCERFYERGTVVTFEAEARLDQVFTGWGGDCAAFGNASCVLTMTGDRTVIAGVVVEVHRLIVHLIGDPGALASVVLTDSTGSTICTRTCERLVPAGDTVTVEAFGDFTGLGGDCSDQGAPCALTMDQDRVVIAEFHYSCDAFCPGCDPLNCGN